MENSITANVTPHEAAERISRVADWWTANLTGAVGKVGHTKARGERIITRWAGTAILMDLHSGRRRALRTPSSLFQSRRTPG